MIEIMRPEPAKHCWRTPPEVFGPLMLEFGVDLDACADETNALVDRFITREDDCLVMPWLRAAPCARSAFMNPPFGGKGGDFLGTGAFVDRAHNQSRHGLTVVVLVESRTDTAWWRRAYLRADEVRIGGRVKFLRLDGTPGTQPKSGHTLFVFRPWTPVEGHPLGPRVSLWATP